MAIRAPDGANKIYHGQYFFVWCTFRTHVVYNTYVHLEFKSEKIGGHSSEAANQVEPLCAPPKTPDQLSTHLK